MVYIDEKLKIILFSNNIKKIHFEAERPGDWYQTLRMQASEASVAPSAFPSSAGRTNTSQSQSSSRPNPAGNPNIVATVAVVEPVIREIDMYAVVVKQTIEVLTDDGKAVLEGIYFDLSVIYWLFFLIFETTLITFHVFIILTPILEI